MSYLPEIINVQIDGFLGSDPGPFYEAVYGPLHHEYPRLVDPDQQAQTAQFCMEGEPVGLVVSQVGVVQVAVQDCFCLGQDGSATGEDAPVIPADLIPPDDAVPPALAGNDPHGCADLLDHFHASGVQNPKRPCLPRLAGMLLATAHKISPGCPNSSCRD